jgi:ankyrin repeat protein
MSSSETYLNLVRDRQLAELAALLTSEPVIDDSAAVHGLQRAIEHGYVDVVDVYLTSGLNANVRGEALRTPLMWAAEAKNIELVGRFLRAGAGVDLTDFFGGVRRTFRDTPVARFLRERVAN